LRLDLVFSDEYLSKEYAIALRLQPQNVKAGRELDV
jgi:hypothetical protein